MRTQVLEIIINVGTSPIGKMRTCGNRERLKISVITSWDEEISDTGRDLML